MSLPPELIRRFVQHLAELEPEMRALESRLSAPDCVRDGPLEELRSIAHKLAGTAEGFGFPHLGKQSNLLEQAIATNQDLPDVLERARTVRIALKSAAQS